MGFPPILRLNSLLRKQELELGSQLPVGRSGGPCDVVVGSELHVHGLAADLEHPPEAASDRHGPAVAVAGFPVGGDDR